MLMCALVYAAPASDPAKRVQPPVAWSPDVLDAFFDDAREHLVGQRPTASLAAPRVVVAQNAPAVQDNGVFKWSQVVDAETLTAEIKRINNQLATTLRKSSAFQGGGNLVCRRDFGLLAALFGVVAEFDDEVRWQSSAAEMQKRCLQACRNCKTASAQAYAGAKDTHETLVELLRGQGVGAGETASEQDTLLAERTLLMQVMELGLQERLSPTLTDKREFRKKTQQAIEQAQVLAVLAKIIQHEGYEYTDDEDYLAEARALRSASSELSRAAKDKNYEAARSAAGQVGQSCSRCHEGYRG